MIAPEDLVPQRRNDVIETIAGLRGTEYASRLQIAAALMGTAAQCESAIIDGSRVATAILIGTLSEMLRVYLPQVTGVSEQDIQAAVKAQASDIADVKAKVRKEMGL